MKTEFADFYVKGKVPVALRKIKIHECSLSCELVAKFDRTFGYIYDEPRSMR